MRQHIKKQRMSRSKVATLRTRRKFAKNRKKGGSYWYKMYVNNCTIPEQLGDKRPVTFDIPKEGYPQPKPLMRNHVEKREVRGVDQYGCIWYDPIFKTVSSTFPTKKYNDIQKKLWKNLGKAAKMEAYAQDKLKKWERKNPRPCEDDDLFKDEMIPAWEAERNNALERFRDFVVSVYDKLPLIGRFQTNDNKFEEKKVADIKDVNGEGHDVNELKPDSKLLKKVQKVTDKVHAKHANLVCTNLKDHKRKKGRIVLPKAA